MKFSPRYKRYDLGRQSAGTVVEVVLSCVNNVLLMDHENFARYAEAKTYKFIGGRTEKSPARFTVPATGQWHVVVDKTGFQTLANSNVRAIPPQGRKAANSATTADRAAGSTSVKGELVGGRSDRPYSEADAVSRILNELNAYKHIANTDVLTGLDNRRAFDARMAKIFSAPASLSSTALILTDIDHFKSFNDTHGHAIGDCVLKHVAQTIRKSLPDNAYPARIGGEEFAIVAHGVSRDTALQIAETIRRAVVAGGCVDEATGTDCGTVTISLGLCMADAAGAITDLYNRCDTALYASKKAGRNRTTVFDESLLDTSAAQTG